MNDFVNQLAEILEVESETLKADFAFRSIEEWDSMKGFSIIVMMEQDYAHPMSVDEFMQCQTVADLARAAGVLG